MSGADDLNDGLVYSFEEVADISESDEAEIEKTEDGKPSTAEGKKRHLEEEEINKDTESAKDEAKNSTSTSKRQKKLQKSKLHQKKIEQVQYETDMKKKLPQSSPEEISEYFAKLIRKANPKLSALELDDLYLKKSDFISTAAFNEKTRNLINFGEFMNEYSKAPKAIIFSMSNIRVADISRSLQGGKSCVKLFAKNKLQQDIDVLKEISEKKNKKLKDIRYYVASPTRMEKLLEVTDFFFQGKDKLDIILDASYLDPKNNSLISSDQTMILCRVLKKILFKKSSVKVLLY